MKISEYEPGNEADILREIAKDPNWAIFTNGDTIDAYRKSLEKSITYVSYNNGDFCGYVRAILDEGLSVYVSELFVVPGWRNHKTGQALLERVSRDFSNITVYALSDEDSYYERKGYIKAGSVFKLQGSG
jgi:GNAT superfamily N-acetyltransferase